LNFQTIIYFQLVINFDDLITIINFQHSKILDCDIKSKICVKIGRKKKNSSLILITFDNLELKKKRVSKFDRKASFLQKLIKNVHRCGKLLTLQFDINDLFSKLFKPPENSSRAEKIGE